MHIPDHMPDPPQPGDVDFHGHRCEAPAGGGEVFCAGGCGYPVARPGAYCGECLCEEDGL